MKKAIKALARMIHQTDPTACFAIQCWDGETVSFGDSPKVTLRLRSQASAGRIIRKGFLGFGEAYMAGDVEVEGKLEELFRLGLCIDFLNFPLPFRQKVCFFARCLMHRDTLRCAPKNISYHYDLGDEFYALYLDRTMAYSCAYFKTPEDTLEQAQVNKYEHIARKLLLKPGESLLDIGCGWGGMLIHAARNFGVSGLGLTLSRKQCEFANHKISQLGLDDRLAVICQDYREATGSFDKVVSIGMFEHVGKKFIPLFFKKVSELLRPGGVGLLHTIGKEAPSPPDPWIQRYIFPGGYLPTLDEIVGHMGKLGLSVLDIENLRLHYAKTLEKWAQNYERNLQRVREMFDEAFARRWRLFLNGTAAGFKYGENRLYQVQFSNGLNNRLPVTRSYLYGG